MKKSLVSSLAAFVLVWIFVVPNVIEGQGHGSGMASAEDRFTDSDGARIATDQALWDCYQVVMRIGKEYAAEGKTPPIGLPEFVYSQCMFAHGQYVSQRT